VPIDGLNWKLLGLGRLVEDNKMKRIEELSKKSWEKTARLSSSRAIRPSGEIQWEQLVVIPFWCHRRGTSSNGFLHKRLAAGDVRVRRVTRRNFVLALPKTFDARLLE
jgi:hypothetical protein